MHEKKESFGIWILKYFLPPLLILVIAGAAIRGAVLMRPKPEKKPPSVILPAVETMAIRSETMQLSVSSQGVVQPLTETLMVAEVAGRVLWVSDSFLTGGYFSKGESLLRIDDSDYKANLATAKSRHAEARLAYEQEKALAEQAAEDWKEMGAGRAASELTLRKPQLERAQAALEAAQSGVSIAERDLERTTIRAPYDGRVRERFVDIGQMVAARQTQLARIYSIDAAEIRLPLSLSDIQYLELPENYSNETKPLARKPRLTVAARFGERVHQWEGVIDRMEGAIDPRTRLAYAIARIQSPYEKLPNDDRPPLKVGLFVEAIIEGKSIENAFRIPRQALREGNRVYVVDAEGLLQFKQASVYKIDSDWAIVTDGLSDGDQVCATTLEYAVEGMSVRVESRANAK